MTRSQLARSANLPHAIALERFLVKSEVHRDNAESLVRGVEVLTRKLAALEVVPLDVLDRYERALVAAHTANLLRLSDYPEIGE